MNVEAVKKDLDSITYQVTIPIRGGILNTEEAIQEAVKEIVFLAAKDALPRFDTDGAPIKKKSC